MAVGMISNASLERGSSRAGQTFNQDGKLDASLLHFLSSIALLTKDSGYRYAHLSLRINEARYDETCDQGVRSPKVLTNLGVVPQKSRRSLISRVLMSVRLSDLDIS